jgi:hypothetical protein
MDNKWIWKFRQMRNSVDCIESAVEEKKLTTSELESIESLNNQLSELTKKFGRKYFGKIM